MAIFATFSKPYVISFGQVFPSVSSQEPNTHNYEIAIEWLKFLN